MKLKWTWIGLLVLAAGCTQMRSHKESDEGDEQNEVKMSINDVPAPVRQTLSQQDNGASIKHVDRETSNGKLVYEADVVQNGQNMEIKVDPSGQIVSKRVDNEDNARPKKEDEDKD